MRSLQEFNNTYNDYNQQIDNLVKMRSDILPDDFYKYRMGIIDILTKRSAVATSIRGFNEMSGKRAKDTKIVMSLYSTAEKRLDDLIEVVDKMKKDFKTNLYIRKAD